MASRKRPRLPLVVAVTGASSGLGKSSLSSMLAADLRRTAHRVDLFLEEELLKRPAFEDVASEFAVDRRVKRDTLLLAAKRYVDGVASERFDVAVVDSAFPYVPSLIAWGYDDDDIRAFLDDLGGCLQNAQVVQLHLVGDIRAGLSRAIEREEPGWIDLSIEKTRRYEGLPFEVVTQTDLERYLDSCAQRTVTALDSAPWPVHVIDTDTSLDATFEEALRIVDTYLAAT